MTERDDHQLLAEFARENSEAAFAALVGRHINLVYATALRSVGNTHAAEEITQAVFIILAQKAGKLSSRVVVSGWLYQTTRLTAANFLRGEIRRQQREQEAYMQSTLNEPDATTAWRQIAPLLDGALEKLSDQDRNAVVLRFFENKSLAEVGVALGASEDAAKMRVNRALEKLRKIFSKRGVTFSATLIAGAVSIGSVQAAPAGLAATISTVAITKGAAAGGSTLALVKGALKLMAWTKAKTTVVILGAVLLAAGTATPIIVHHNRANASIFTSVKELSNSDNVNYETLTGATPAQVARTFLEACSQEDWLGVASYWRPDPRNKNVKPAIPDSFKQRYGGLKIISIGKPFKGRISIARFIELQPEARDQFKGMTPDSDFEAGGVFVAYEVQLKDGTNRKWQLSIRCDNPDHHWYYDSGM